MAAAVAATGGAAAPAIIVVVRPAERARGGLPPGWEALSFKKIERHTRYSVVADGDGHVLRAESEAAASGLYRPLDLDPRVYRRLSWRVEGGQCPRQGGRAQEGGDDYAARIYVAFRHDPETATAWERLRFGAIRLLYGRYPPRHVINYIWDNRLPVGTSLDNAYTDRAKMIVVAERDGPRRPLGRRGAGTSTRTTGGSSPRSLRRSRASPS